VFLVCATDASLCDTPLLLLYYVCVLFGRFLDVVYGYQFGNESEYRN
jgi:hypothetical protein